MGRAAGSSSDELWANWQVEAGHPVFVEPDPIPRNHLGNRSGDRGEQERSGPLRKLPPKRLPFVHTNRDVEGPEPVGGRPITDGPGQSGLSADELAHRIVTDQDYFPLSSEHLLHGTAK